MKTHPLTLDDIRSLAARPFEMAKQWQERTARPLIGYFPGFIPEEIVHAGGALSVAFVGTSPRTTRADEFVPGYMCSHVKAVLDAGLSGDLNFMNFFFIPYLCDSSRNLIHTWELALPQIPADSLRCPKKSGSSDVMGFYVNELRRFRLQVETVVGHRISDESLQSSIRLGNSIRQTLRKLAERFALEPRRMSSFDFYAVLSAFHLTPWEDFASFLERFLESPPAPISAEDRDPWPVFVKGKLGLPSWIMGIFDELSLVPAGDDLFLGRRTITREVPEHGDPMVALALRDLHQPPYPTSHAPCELWEEAFLSQLRACGAKGVVFLLQKFCEPSAFELPQLEHLARKQGLPTVFLQTSVGQMSAERVRLQLQAFREMLADW